MSEDRHEQEALRLIGSSGGRTEFIVSAVAAALRERDAKLEELQQQVKALAAEYQDLGADRSEQLQELRAKLEQAEAERDKVRAEIKELTEPYFVTEAEMEEMEARIDMRVRDLRAERDALIAAIQRGYCPNCHCRRYDKLSPVDHSPDCRVAPLLGGGKE